MRVLLVQSDSAVGDQLARMLRDNGFDVRSADSLASARALCNDEQFDVLVCDVDLADGSGWSLSDIIEECGLRAIATTGHWDEQLVKAGARAGFSSILLKPVSSDDLDRAVSGNN